MRRRPPPDTPPPQGIDPWSGFKIPLTEFTRQWDGDYVWQKTCDRRNSQDFVRGVRDDQSLPFARPETPDVFMAEPLTYEDRSPIILENGQVLMTEGQTVTAASL